MSVLCFASLKGGVGKTSLSLNVAHALAMRGCEVLLIDCDPASHATRLLSARDESATIPSVAELIFSTSSKPFQGSKSFQGGASPTNELFHDGAPARRIGALGTDGNPVCGRVRDGLSVLGASADLRHFLWGQGARLFSRAFPRLIQDLSVHFDHIVIDTCPDFNVVVRNCLAVADLAVVPVDSSEMSIHSLEELLESARHIQKPTWAVIRTMVNMQASRTRTESASRLGKMLQERIVDSADWGEKEVDSAAAGSDDNADGFLSRVRKHCNERSVSRGATSDIGRSDNERADGESGESDGDDSQPIFLLNSYIPRTEHQNRLTFLGRTSFDRRDTLKLSDAYANAARELEYLTTLLEEGDLSSGDDMGELFEYGEQAEPG